jgi:predicted component of type VI protein secretion system
MVQLQILSGKMAGTTWSSRHFPFSIGRSPHTDFQVEEAGIWDKHFEVLLENAGFVIAAVPNAFVTIDGKKVERAELKNGDVIEIGAAKIRVSLQPTTQRGVALREISTWIALALLCLGQIALIYWLIQ